MEVGTKSCIFGLTCMLQNGTPTAENVDVLSDSKQLSHVSPIISEFSLKYEAKQVCVQQMRLMWHSNSMSTKPIFNRSKIKQNVEVSR